MIPAVAASIVGIGIGAAIWGGPGALGGLLGSVTVLIFFSVHLAIDRISRNLDPMATMALAMFSYFAKVFLMGAFLLVITKTTSPASISRPAFAITALLSTGAWLAGEIRAFMKLRLVLAALPLSPDSELKG
jgi:hypothetical protein